MTGKKSSSSPTLPGAVEIRRVHVGEPGAGVEERDPRGAPDPVPGGAGRSCRSRSRGPRGAAWPGRCARRGAPYPPGTARRRRPNPAPTCAGEHVRADEDVHARADEPRDLVRRPPVPSPAHGPVLHAQDAEAPAAEAHRRPGVEQAAHPVDVRDRVPGGRVEREVLAPGRPAAAPGAPCPSASRLLSDFVGIEVMALHRHRVHLLAELLSSPSRRSITSSIFASFPAYCRMRSAAACSTCREPRRSPPGGSASSASRRARSA